MCCVFGCVYIIILKCQCHCASPPQAYRIEPLINQLYAQVKPMKIDSAGKPSQEALDHADGCVGERRTSASAAHATPVVQSKASWFVSSLTSLLDKATSKKPPPEPGKMPDKVSDCLCVYPSPCLLPPSFLFPLHTSLFAYSTLLFALASGCRDRQ